MVSKTIVLLIITIVLSILSGTAVAKTTNPQANLNAQIPEVSGDYEIKDKPGMRVRVFVHNEKPYKNESKNPQSVELSACEDSDSESVIGSTGWRLPVATVKYRVNTSSAPSSVRSSLLSIISSDFSKWNNSIVSSSKPALTYDGFTSKTRSSYDGQNIIAWGRTSGSTLGVTYVWYYTSTGQVAEVDTIMNSRLVWDLACTTTKYNAENILIHELGHWYGLDDEYTNEYKDNTMYGYGSKGEVKKITPENGDFAGINLIY